MKSIEEFKGNRDRVEAIETPSMVKIMVQNGPRIAEFLYSDGITKAKANAKLFVQSKTNLILLIEEIKYLEMWMNNPDINQIMFNQMKERKEFIERSVNKSI